MSRAETPKSHRQVLDIVTSTLQQLHPNAPQPFFDDLETIVPAYEKLGVRLFRDRVLRHWEKFVASLYRKEKMIGLFGSGDLKEMADYEKFTKASEAGH